LIEQQSLKLKYELRFKVDEMAILDFEVLMTVQNLQSDDLMI